MNILTEVSNIQPLQWIQVLMCHSYKRFISLFSLVFDSINVTRFIKRWRVAKICILNQLSQKNDLKTKLQTEPSFLKRNIAILDRIIKYRIYGYLVTAPQNLMSSKSTYVTMHKLTTNQCSNKNFRTNQPAWLAKMLNCMCYKFLFLKRNGKKAVWLMT